MKKYLLLVASSLLMGSGTAQAINILSASFSPATISAETVGSSTGTTITFQTDTPADITIAITRVTNGAQVATLTQNAMPAGTNNIYWNGLWLLGSDLGRQDGSYQFTINASTNGTTATPFTIPTLLSITSVDIHNTNVTPSFDASGNPSFPYLISYALAKNSLVTVMVKNSSQVPVRTLAKGVAQFDETVATNTLTWDGLDDSGHPVLLGIYTITVDATDSATGDKAITRTRTAAVGSLANLNTDPQTLFASNAFVYPNPVRGGQATFQVLAVRNNANITLKIYTITGTLVHEDEIDGTATGNIALFSWNATNDSGRKVGRGLYYYVLRENDSSGTLQTVKKLAVIQ